MLRQKIRSTYWRIPLAYLPQSAEAYFHEYVFEVWRSNPAEAWTTWLEVIAEFKLALADLFNAEAESFCPQVNISGALAKVIQSFPQQTDKNVILLNENDFPSVGFVLKQAERIGFKVRMIHKSEDPQDVSTWSRALTEDVCCALITHSHYNTSRLVPVEEITRITDERNIISIVDVAQSAGIVPIDLKKWRADIVLGSCVKWLCGGPGAAFLWVRPDIVGDLEPLDVGWFSHQNPDAFDIHQFQYADNSARFWGGTPDVLPFAIAANSIRQLSEIGIENIRAHNTRLVSLMTESVDRQNIVSPL